jgi:hypothetical protein
MNVEAYSFLFIRFVKYLLDGTMPFGDGKIIGVPARYRGVTGVSWYRDVVLFD